MVLSTYNTVAAEVPTSVTNTPSKGKKMKSTAGPLSTVRWKRVVADEGHVLKNPRTKSESVMLNGDRADEKQCRLSLHYKRRGDGLLQEHRSSIRLVSSSNTSQASIDELIVRRSRFSTNMLDDLQAP